ncbi:DNA alkylation repair protein [Frigidibacter sp. MR17.14]|uniref:DNA alkylation repair protein n=1 Tax=Frigidibacter sp. MR17.14 TaxID=3126509 RepID=UPI003012E5C0
MTFDDAMTALQGLDGAALDLLVRDWRADVAVEERIELAAQLWDTGETRPRIAAAKLLTQARIAEDDEVWALILDWAGEPQALAEGAVAQAVAKAGERRLAADPSRLVELADLIDHPALEPRRTALAMTLPFAKMAFPKDEDLAIRETVLDWAALLWATRATRPAAEAWVAALARHDAARADLWRSAREGERDAAREASQPKPRPDAGEAPDPDAPGAED